MPEEVQVQAHESNGHWELVDRKDIPGGMPVLPSVWSMKRKRRIDTREVYKWKARLTVHGGQAVLFGCFSPRSPNSLFGEIFET
jgi:hypothetical protein